MGDVGFTLSPLVTEYVRGRVKRGEILPATGRTMSYTLWSLAESFGKRPLNQLNRKAIDRWLEAHNERLSAAYRRIRLSTVRHFCEWLVEERKIKANPTRGVPAVKIRRGPPKTLQHREVAALLKSLAGDTRATAIVWLMVGAGCRCVEVSRLNVEDYDPRKKLIRLTGKGGHDREVPVPVTVHRAIEAYLDEAGRVAGPLIRRRYTTSLFGYDEGAHYGRLKPETLSIYLQKWMREAGIKGRNWDGRSAHGLRRTCGTDVMNTSKDIRVVQQMLGHAKLETTAAYVAPVSPEELRAAMEGREYELYDEDDDG
jgi:integrase/recombinase XerC